MKELSKEVLAYSLQNAIEHGKAQESRILPKLFQHGLEKKDIVKIMPIIRKAIEEVNSMSEKERAENFEKLKSYVKERAVEEKSLEELPGSASKQKMVFRIAPFPSGALHIGNAKTFILNALYSEKYGGDLILVMDDTIGSSEKPLTKDGYKLISDALSWLKIKYKKPIVYKSDRLKIYYEYAEKLIEKGRAYVCYCPQEELRENRAYGKECSCRQFPLGIQKLRWKEMFKTDEGHAVLRLKTDMQHPNPAFRDRVLFKISDREHPRVGKKYRVWPSLEMSWAIDDYKLGITHIIRGNDLAIETEMEKFIWSIFGWSHKKVPEVMHTGLVRIDGLGKVSKSKAQKEVLSGEFIGWDDPRTWSVQSLERRGIKAEVIRQFVEEIGLNKQDITIPIEALYSINRKLIDANSDRHSFIFNPKRIEIDNSLSLKEVSVPVHPDKDETRKVKVGNKIYISSEDYEKFKGKEVRLLHLFNIRIEEKCRISSVENKNIPRINWVSDGSEVKARILMPDGNWTEGLAEESIEKIKKGEIVQFERFGFVRYDGSHKGFREFWFAHK